MDASQNPSPRSKLPWTPPTGTIKRPYRIQRDVELLNRDKPVSKILQSDHFKQELEAILMGQLGGVSDSRDKAMKASLKRLQDNVIPAHSMTPPRRQPLQPIAGTGVIPVDDLRGTSASKYSLAEKHVRCKLAAMYRLVNLRGWDIGIYGHITARAPGREETFLLNPFGLHYSEITASSLVRVDLDGDIIDPGSTQLGVNRAGYVIHSAIHAARRDIKCVVHLHTTPGTAVSAMACGLLPISQDALMFAGVSYHPFRGVACDEAEKEELARDLGPVNKVMILRNHGLIATGTSIEEAFAQVDTLVRACQAQVAALSAGMSNLILLDRELVNRTARVLNAGAGGVGDEGFWKPGELEYEAEMRVLDNKGYNTGYPYKGMHLLLPGPDPDEMASYEMRKAARRKKREEKKKKEQQKLQLQQQQQQQQQSNPWQFLDERTAANNSPTQSQISVNEDRHENLWNFHTENAASNPTAPASSTSCLATTTLPQQSTRNGPSMNNLERTGVVGKMNSELGSHLSSLKRAQMTAQAVAHSTGQAVQKLSHHQQMEQHSSQDHTHSPSTISPALPDEAVVNSIAPVRLLQKPVPFLTDGFAHSTPVAGVGMKQAYTNAHLPAQTPDELTGLSPIEKAVYTAEQVAESTGESANKLSQSLSGTKT